MTSNTSPRVTVCIPTIDRPHYLREAIESVLKQTWTDYRIVVSDNSGSAERQQRIDEVLSLFPDARLTLQRNVHQLAPYESFNSLIDAASGEFCVFLPDDDRLCPTFLSRAIAALEAHPECAFTFADHWIIRGDGTRDTEFGAEVSARFGRDALREGVYRHEQLFGIVLKQAVCLQTMLFRRSLLERFRFLPGITSLDQSLFVRMSDSGEPIHGYYIDEPVFEYRIHGAQMTSTTKREALIRDHIAILEGVKTVPSAHVAAVKAKLGREYLALSLLEAERGDTREARGHAMDSLRFSVSVRAVLGGLLVSSAPFAIPTARRFIAAARRLRAS